MAYDRRMLEEQEEVIAVGGDVTLKELLASACFCKEAAAAAEGIRLDLEAGSMKADMTVEQVLFQDISCSCRHQGEGPCLKDGGACCYGMTGDDQRLSVMGNKKVGTPACTRACPAGVDISGVLEHMMNGEKLKAQRLLMNDHPLAETVCLACGRCSAHCVRSVPDKANGVSAAKIMHWLGADIGRHPEIFFIPPSGDSKRWIAIEEVTMTGLAAAYYLRRMGHHVVIFQRKEAPHVLAPWGQGAVDTMEGPLASYMDHLAYMGVVFEDQRIQEAEGAYAFDRRLSWGTPPEGGSVGHLLDAISLGVKTAEKINLAFGLRSYLEPKGPLGSIQYKGVQAPPVQWETVIEDTEVQAVCLEASRCLDCGCLGVSESRTGTALFMLEAEIHTDQRMIRIQDHLGDIDPWEQLGLEEKIIRLEIPKSSAFISGCVAEEEITLAYAFLVRSGKLIDLRMTFGGIAPVFIRLTEAELALKGRRLDELWPEQAASRIMDMLKPKIVVLKDNKRKSEHMERLLARALEISKIDQRKPYAL